MDRGCDAGFSPSFLGGATSAVAGHRTGLTLRLVRREGEEAIDRFSTTLPRGLLPVLTGVSSCPGPQAEAGDCPATSRIGQVTVTAGAGSAPLAFSGSAFLTEPYKGAPFGIAIAIPAVAGPFDLGVVVVRGRVLVDPRSARLTIALDSLPRILKGIPLRIRSFELSTVERPGMFTAPTSCERQELSAEASRGARLPRLPRFRSAPSHRPRPRWRGVTLELFGSLHLSQQGTSSVTFAGMPDAPISNFVIDLPKGPYSAFGASFLRGAGGSLCGHRIAMATTLVGYNGRHSHGRTNVAASCRGLAADR